MWAIDSTISDEGGRRADSHKHEVFMAVNMMAGLASGTFSMRRSTMATCKLEDAAKQTVDYFVKDGMLLGLGTGSASSAAISYVGQKLSTGALRDVVGVPMSSLSASKASQAGLPLRAFENNMKLDFAFNDADLVQEGTLFAIIGRKNVEGRESILKEKTIAKAANQFVFIVDEPVFTQELTGVVPVLIQQEDWLETAEEIDDLFLGDAEVWRRPSAGEAGPMGGDCPLVTKEGHFILDLLFTSTITNPSEIAESLEAINGVVGHGLILDSVYASAVAGRDGVKIRTSLFKRAFTSMQ
ncbi:hypothetical protein GOP47_0019028 [Adiantum capillus-veneris]|uniref:ribose-5-phosphate isomerase n=1 Tax=Adiantum capillus-veneris TaxID=13818 RepID=A0A9D4UFJ3_ADICA|nr:hypothetical protein GOP47_0019028 [Adiantum capillus-veneris]